MDRMVRPGTFEPGMKVDSKEVKKWRAQDYRNKVLIIEYQDGSKEYVKSL